MPGDHFDAPLRHQSFVEGIAVVGLVADQPLGEVGEKSLLKGGLDERYFTRRSAGQMYGERKTLAVADCHDLATLPAFGWADRGAPFFAAVKLASINPSIRSSL